MQISHRKTTTYLYASVTSLNLCDGMNEQAEWMSHAWKIKGVWQFFRSIQSASNNFISFCLFTCSKKQPLQLRPVPLRILPIWLQTINSRHSSHQIMCRRSLDLDRSHYHKIINNQWDRFHHQIVLRLVHDLCLQLWVSSPSTRFIYMYMNYLLLKEEKCAYGSVVHFC